jgi:acetyl-CoA synthetase
MNLYKKYVTEEFDSNGILTKFKIDSPNDFNFAFDIVDTIAKQNPDKKALVWCNDKGADAIYTFSDIMKKSNQTANYFKSLGIKKGDKVMCILKRHYQFWFVAVALCKIGAILLPATNQLTKKDLLYRFGVAGVTALICTSEGDISGHCADAISEYETPITKIIVNGSKDGWSDFDQEYSKYSDAFERPTGDEANTKDDTMLMYFTSGTSGYPKCACMSYDYPLGHIMTAKYWHNVEEDGIHFTVAETGWAKSVWGKLYGQWICEAAVFVFDFDKFDPLDMLRMIEKYKITTFCAPPTIYRFFIKSDISEFDLSSLTYATTAGEAVNPEVYNKFLEVTGLKLKEGFGQTETTLTLFNQKNMLVKPGSMGKPSPQYNVAIVDDDCNPVSPGVIGEIVLKIPEGEKQIGVFTGYYKEEEKTKSMWHDGFYHTGDLAWNDEDNYYYYVSRKDDLIKSSGYRISPFEIESVLMEHKAVMECAVTGVPDELRGHTVKATIVLTKEYAPTEELKIELQNYVKETTAPYKYPRIIDFVTELPKTISGKIRRVEIRENK